MRTILIAAIFALPVSAQAGWFGPSTYNDCLIEAAKSLSPEALYALKEVIEQKCGEQFWEHYRCATVADCFFAPKYINCK